MNTVRAGAMRAMTAPDAACATNSMPGLTASITPAIATPWMTSAIWNTRPRAEPCAHLGAEQDERRHRERARGDRRSD